MAARFPPRGWTLGVSFCVVFIHLVAVLPKATAIGCFVCTSINGSEPDCEDTFNNTGRFYRQECFAGRKGRSGLFPGTECIKLTAKDGDGVDMLVRMCVVDNGGVNSETEIGRIDHCGFVNWMLYDGEQVPGCILACNTDGCNIGTSTVFQEKYTTVITLVLLFLLRMYWHEAGF